MLGRLRSRDEAGFSLVEILVSIVIAGLVAAAVLPLLLSGQMAGNLAKAETQAKGLAQERLEQIRNYPFYVAFDSGDYSDVLDVFFRDASSPVADATVTGRNPCARRGYVAATSSYLCELAPSTVGGLSYRQRVETTFLSSANSVITPNSMYKSYQSLTDAPASGLLGVVVTTQWDVGAKSKSYVLRSSIVRTNGDAPLITSRFQGSALRVTSTIASVDPLVPATDTLQFEAGIVSGEGSKSTASTAQATAVGAVGSLASGGQHRGANATLQAPADDVRGTINAAAVDLDGVGCTRVCFGPTTVKDGVAATVSTDVPVIGETTAGLRLRAALARSGASGDRGFSYNNATLTEVATALDVASLPIVSAEPTTSGNVAEAAGHASAVSSGTTSVTSSVSAKTQEIQLFRTAAATQGIVKILLTTASLQCTDVKSGAATVTSDWDATVSVWDGTGYGTYSYQVKKGSTVTLPDELQRQSIAVGPGKTLADYVSSWDSVNPASVDQSSNSAKGEIAAVLSVLTTPTRAGDPASALNISVGSLSCLAEDNQ
jgi:prepilin-type N-terminal cleavage/methylation domain-containing protein